MQRLLPMIGLLGVLALSGCSHDDHVAAPATPPVPPATLQSLPPNAQSAISGAVPPNELKNAQPAPH